MTKEITKAVILQQIEDKFKLRELEPEKFKFAETVVPIYDIRSHVQEHKTLYEEVSITSATAFAFFQVPANERWVLRGYNVIFMAEGAYQISGVYLVRALHSANIIYMDLKKNQAVSYIVNLPLPVILNAGDTLNILVDTYVSTEDLRLYIDYMVEEVR